MKTEKRIKKILSEFLGLREEELQDGVTFTTDLNIDPLDLDEAVSKLYDEFDVEEERQSFKTVGELISFFKDRLDEIEG